MPLTINSNLSSLIVQSNLKQSTFGLNQAIERMTTGFKINGAKDNAANYSISTQMSTKIGAYQVAEDNASMGLDLLTTAMDSLDTVSSNLSRIRDLAEQAANGTYGESSLKAIQLEINARLEECNRILETTEYNKIKLFQAEPPEPEVGGSFIEEITPLSAEEAAAQGYILIRTADELQAMQDNLAGKYILMNNIDLEGFDWNPVGINYSNAFTGEFNGNGHVIQNLTIKLGGAGNNALFGRVKGAKIENVGIENVQLLSETEDAYGSSIASLIASAYNATVTNCYATGSLHDAKVSWCIGGLVAYAENTNISACYTDVDMIAEHSQFGKTYAGGLVGYMEYGSANNSFSHGNIVTSGIGKTGGFAACLDSGFITNCFTTGDIESDVSAGGFLSSSDNGGSLIVINKLLTGCYSTGKVVGDNNHADVGGFMGFLSGEAKDCYWNTETAGQTKGVGRYSAFKDYIDGTRGVTTAEIEELKTNGTLFNPTLKTAVFSVETSELPNAISFQVGVNSSESSQISLDLGFSLKLALNCMDSASARNGLLKIDSYLNKINAKQTEYGACQNRLESALEEINTHYENLLSSRSTLRDADVAQESSAYIRNQILQQASATLLATANQTPAIALQLL